MGLNQACKSPRLMHWKQLTEKYQTFMTQVKLEACPRIVSKNFLNVYSNLTVTLLSNAASPLVVLFACRYWTNCLWVIILALWGNHCNLAFNRFLTIFFCQDFKDGDSMRKLPHCGHYFHLSCLDKWLATNGSCPNCRNSVCDDNDV